MSLTNNSYFNLAIYKKEIRALLWVLVLASLLLMFTLPYAYYFYSEVKDKFINERELLPDIDDKPQTLSDDKIIKQSSTYLVEQLKRRSITQNIILFALPILVVALIMGQDRSNKSIDLIASMPLTRKQLFFSKLFAGLTICLIPYVLIFILASLLRMSFPELNIVFGIYDIFIWLIKTLIPLALLYTSSIFVGTLLSPTIGILIVTPVFLAFPIGLGTLLYLNSTVFNVEFKFIIYDIVFKALTLLSPAYYAIHELINYSINIVNLTDTQHIVITIVYTVVLLALSYYLYKRHKMEYSQELLIYPQLEGIFIIGVSVCCALISGPLMYLLFFESLLALIPGYALGAFIGGWIARYLVKMKKTS